MNYLKFNSSIAPPLRNILCLFCFSLLSMSLAFGQDDFIERCATPNPDTAYIKNLPWYGNNIYIDTFQTYLDRIKPNQRSHSALRDLQSRSRIAAFAMHLLD